MLQQMLEFLQTLERLRIIMHGPDVDCHRDFLAICSVWRFADVATVVAIALRIVVLRHQDALGAVMPLDVM